MYEKLQLKIPEYQDIACWWDVCAKPAIRKFCMGVSTRLACVRKDTKKFLFSYLNIALGIRDWKEVVRIREQIKTILLKETMGFVVRSRFKENSESEVASLFHVNREKKNNLDYLKIDDEVSNNKVKIEEEVLN